MKKASSEMQKTQRPALSPEERQNQMIAIAEDLAEKQLMDGTASPSIITHYLKLATQREKIEMELKMKEMELMQAKTQALQSAANIEALYNEAMSAFRRYSGQEEVVEDEDIY